MYNLLNAKSAQQLYGEKWYQQFKKFYPGMRF